MSDLTKLILKPRVITHAVTPPNSVITTNLSGGLSRSRADVLGGASFVSLSWVLEKQHYEYLMAFYISIAKEGALPFLLEIPVLSAECKWVECKFIKNSFKLSSTDGVLRTIVAKVEVLDSRDTASDEELVALVNATGSFDEAEQLEFINMLDRLVNGVPHGSDAVTETLPEHMVIK